MLTLMMVNSYFNKLLANEAVKGYLGRHEPEILTDLKLVAHTISSEEARSTNRKPRLNPFLADKYFL